MHEEMRRRFQSLGLSILGLSKLQGCSKDQAPTSVLQEEMKKSRNQSCRGDAVV